MTREKKRKFRGCRFSLATLFVVVSVVGVFFGVTGRIVYINHQRRQIVYRVAQLGGTCEKAEKSSRLFEPEITAVCLAWTDIDDDDVVQLVPPGTVKRVALDGTRVGDAALAHLGRCEQLADVSLTATRITDEGLRYLAHLPHLQFLCLDMTAVSDAGLAHLSECKSLKYVHANETKVTREGIERLVRTSSVSEVFWSTATSEAVRRALAELCRTGADVTTLDQAALERSPHRRKSRYSVLFATSTSSHPPDWTAQKSSEINRLLQVIAQVEAPDIAFFDFCGHLRCLANLPRIANLSLHSESVCDADLAVLTTVGEVRSLGIFSYYITDNGLRVAAGVPGLERVCIGESSITDQGLAYLEKVPNLKSLSLSDEVNDVGFTEAALEHVRRLRCLEELYVDCSDISDDALRQLKADRPELDITSMGNSITLDEECQPSQENDPLANKRN